MTDIVSSSLAMLLILDFSGSMSQVVDREAKDVTMKKNLSAFASSLGPKEKTELMYFGTEPKNQCKDIKTEMLPAAGLKSRIQRLQPGAFGKTPLAAAILKIPPALKKNNFQQVTLLTDGADSCGENPCEALKVVDQQLDPMGKKIQMLLIGYDLKDDARQLQCFLDLQGKLKNIDLKALFAENRGSMTDMLSKMRQLFPPAGFAVLEIAGAPAEAKFSLAQSGTETRNWNGAFQVVVPKGAYRLQFADPDGKPKNIVLKDREKKAIPFGELVMHPTVKVHLSDEHVQFTLKPLETTLKANPQAKLFKSSELAEKPIHFGLYEVEVQSPEWLRSLKKLNVEIPRVIETENLTLEKFFDEKVKLIANPLWQKRRVMETMGTSYLIDANQKTIPVSAQEKVQWLDAPPASK